ncbi:MAG TPA: heavy-metal-associated domain-containing protein [Microvirga sp.]|jgi:copper chaperone
MCGCAAHRDETAARPAHPADALVVKVEDMICSHCAAAIVEAVGNGFPDARVEADPATRTVLVRGTADLSAVETLIAGAGYTPKIAALG